MTEPDILEFLDRWYAPYESLRTVTFRYRAYIALYNISYERRKDFVRMEDLGIVQYKEADKDIPAHRYVLTETGINMMGLWAV